MERNPKEIIELLGALTPRQREVIVRRFGFGKSEGETLAEIGMRFGITRERVRQIESSAMKLLKEKIEAHPVWGSFVTEMCAFLKSRGGVAPAEVFLKEAGARFCGIEYSHVALFADATRRFNFYGGDRHFYALYYLTKTNIEQAREFGDTWEEHLSGKKESVLQGNYDRHLRVFVENIKLPLEHVESFLAVSKKIHRNPYGDVGLAVWPEIKPQTIRDRIYLVLKKEGKPAHFRDIAKKITVAGFGSRPALAATVHNELIKDTRFVLVGRGMYALKEQGYETGTAREVIRKILSEQGALHPKDVITAAQKGWFFKPNTILVNLQNRAHFERLPDGRYKILES